MPTKPIIITGAPASAQTPPWQRALARAITDPRELLRRLELDSAVHDSVIQADTLFRTLVPENYLKRIRRGDPRDPLLLQVLPRSLETLENPDFIADPVGDHGAMAAPGLLHKYRGRVLLITTGACAVHCRYCFRREFPYGGFSASRDWQPALDYIDGQPDVSEIILSGGDPLTLPDARLATLVSRLEAIPHVRRLRIHTRLPIVLPERVDHGLLSWLGRGRLQHIVVVHANHPREFDPPVDSALTQLRAAGITLLNQSVLLAGVNDDIETLYRLQESSFAAGVLPYYLHLLDRARGTSHFEVDEQRGKALYEAMRCRLPGYLLPKLVREIPGTPAKTPA